MLYRSVPGYSNTEEVSVYITSFVDMIWILFNGKIKLIDLYHLQFTVFATDNRLCDISRTGQATVTVSVLRDIPPEFTNLPRTVAADEADQAGRFILQIQGRDDNLIVSIHSFFFFFQDNTDILVFNLS